MENTLVYNIPLALFGVLKAIFYCKPNHVNYLINLFYYVDILMNAISGGNGTITISARTGYFSNYYQKHSVLGLKFWKAAEAIIDFTFYPMDGKGHCKQAHAWAVERVLKGTDSRVEFMHGPVWSLVLLIAIILIACILLIPLLRLGKFLKLY